MTERTPGAWARGVTRVYLSACAIALAWMVIETVGGFELRAGGILSAFLSVPWSMLAATFLPALPTDGSPLLGVLVRAAILAVFMLLNVAILRGMASRSEHDLRSGAKD